MVQWDSVLIDQIVRMLLLSFILGYRAGIIVKMILTRY